jgi:hypothetical protein
MTEQEIEQGKQIAVAFNLFAKEAESLQQPARQKMFRTMYHGAILAIRACRGDKITEVDLRIAWDWPEPSTELAGKD